MFDSHDILLCIIVCQNYVHYPLQSFRCDIVEIHCKGCCIPVKLSLYQLTLWYSFLLCLRFIHNVERLGIVLQYSMLCTIFRCSMSNLSVFMSIRNSEYVLNNRVLHFKPTCIQMKCPAVSNCLRIRAWLVMSKECM